MNLRLIKKMLLVVSVIGSCAIYASPANSTFKMSSHNFKVKYNHVIRRAADISDQIEKMVLQENNHSSEFLQAKAEYEKNRNFNKCFNEQDNTQACIQKQKNALKRYMKVFKKSSSKSLKKMLAKSFNRLQIDFKRLEAARNKANGKNGCVIQMVESNQNRASHRGEIQGIRGCGKIVVAKRQRRLQKDKKASKTFWATALTSQKLNKNEPKLKKIGFKKKCYLWIKDYKKAKNKKNKNKRDNLIISNFENIESINTLRGKNVYCANPNARVRLNSLKTYLTDKKQSKTNCTKKQEIEKKISLLEKQLAEYKTQNSGLKCIKASGVSIGYGKKIDSQDYSFNPSNFSTNTHQ